MLGWRSRQEGHGSSQAGANETTSWLLGVPMFVLLNAPSPLAAAGGESWSSPGGSVLGVLALACVSFVITIFLARMRLKAAGQGLQKAREFADHREYERNLAQQELVRRLEEERELAKEKLQFESQLAEYEKYAPLAQLALGAAHEINNPLLGIMSHLELEWKNATADQRTEIEQCVE